MSRSNLNTLAIKSMLARKLEDSGFDAIYLQIEFQNGFEVNGADLAGRIGQSGTEYSFSEYCSDVADPSELDKAVKKIIKSTGVDLSEPAGKVVTLSGQEFKHDEPRQDVIDMLKDMLERAESGELRSIVAVGDLSDGHLLKAFGGQPEQVMPLYAELTVAWQEFRERYIQS